MRKPPLPPALALGLGGLVALLALFAPARARAADTQEIAAEKLFDEGHALLLQKRWAEACDKLAASEALAPAGGTELNLGECFDALGKTASAWGAYRKAAARARAAHAAAAEAIANQRASALEPRLRRIALHVAETRGGVEVRLDDAVVARDAWGEAIPVDPGAHVVTATRAGATPFRWSGDVRDGDVVVDVPALADVPPPAPAASFFGPLGGALLATGVVAAGVGFGLGARVLSLNGDARDACPVPSQCTSPAAVEAAASAKDFALASTVLVVAGLAVAAVGVVFLVTAPRGEPARTVALVPTLGGLLLRGTY